MTDRVYAEELAHDSGVKLTQHDLDEAMDSIIDDLFEGKSVGGFHLDAYVEKFAEDISAQLILDRKSSFELKMRHLGDMLETLIRRELEDSDAVRERAVELAQEGE